LTISVLAGGTGSIKLVRGLAATAKKQDIVVICNVGDNIWMHGLYVCPDIDTITYGLANMLDQKRGWGIKDDSFQCLSQMKKIGGPSWFALGDKDLAMHLLRTSMIKDGNTLSEVTDFFRNCYCVRAKLIPATDQEMSTRILTSTKGDMHLQEFWVKYKGRPTVTGVRYNNANNAIANAAAIDAIKRSRAIVISPANPISSIGPIVALSDLRKELVQNRDKVIAISPLIGKRALSGPAIKYMKALRFQNSSIGVARYYHDFVSKFIISVEDHSMKLQIEALKMHVYETNIRMKTRRDEVRLGKYILKLMEKN
jgi:LPPG:FO 2-phospho-L-lactate transferase